MNQPTQFRKITILRFVLAGLVLLLSIPALFADGIASRYPNDVGIGNDPLVLLFDGFENYVQASDVRIENGGVWDTGGGNYTRISTEQHFSGNKSYEMDFPIINVETQMGLQRFISPVEPVLFVRAYFRYDPNFYLAPGSSHKGISMRGRYPGPCGGTPSDGRGWFLFLLQNNIEGFFQSGEQEPGFGHVYAYWPHQRGDCGDHWYPTGHLGPSVLSDWLLYPYLYPDFVARPNFNVPRGQWFCYEFMVKTNDIGQNNGEIKVWKDGIVVADFPDLFIRSIPDLMIDAVRLVFHADHSEQVNKLWWDNIVIARSYIGPISTPTPTPTPGAATAVVADFDSNGHTDWVVHLVGTTLTAIVYMNDNVAIGANLGPT